MQRYIIVTGIPASGKSTIGYLVAKALGLPVLDKDEILEATFNSQGIGNAKWRSQLSRAAESIIRWLNQRNFQRVTRFITPMPK